MDLIKIGKYIAGKRKSLGMTQKQLAEKLGMSDKSVSKWERGVCLPDVSVYKELCSILGISLNEFLAGEDIAQENMIQKSETNIIEVIRDNIDKQKCLKVMKCILLVISICAVSVIGFTIYRLKKPQNYISPVAKDSIEMQTAELLAGPDGAFVYKFITTDEYKKLRLHIYRYESGKLSDQDKVEMGFEDIGSPKSGEIVMVPDFDTYVIKLIISGGGSRLSTEIPVLENVEKRRPDLFQKCTGLSPIVGKVTDNIGYASEIPGQNKSYTQIVCDSFGQALEEIMSEYMKKNIPLTIKQEYDKRLKEMMQKGYKIEFGGKQKIAIETLYSYVPSFKKDVLNKFRFCLSNNDINLNNICFNNKSKKEIETMYGAQKNDILNPEVLNRIITLPNGKKMTILQYYKVNNLEYWVPFEAKVTFKNGRTVSGREFLSESVDRLEKYNTWEELVLHNNIMIERHPNREQYKRQNFILKEQGRQIEEQMNSSLLYDSKDNNLDMNYDSSGVSR